MVTVALGCDAGKSTTGAAGRGGTTGSAGSAGTGGTTGAGGAGGGTAGTGAGGRGGAAGGGGRGGSGGAAGTTGGRGGGGGAVCTSTTIPSCTPATSPYASNGWVSNGTFKGYATTFGIGIGGGYILAPPDYDNEGAYTCAAGALYPNTRPESQAGFHWNVNQAMTPANAPPMTVTPIGAGLLINAPGTTRSMRVNLNDATTTWCAYLPQDGGGVIPWSSFKTECWPGGESTAYALQPFVSVQISAPARETEPTCFCFCVVSIAPAAM